MGILRDRSGEIVDMIKCMSLDICCVQKTRFRGNLVRMISGKAAVYRLFWIRKEKDCDGVGIFLAKESVDHIRDTTKVNDRMIVIKVLVQGIITSVFSVFVPHCG